MPKPSETSQQNTPAAKREALSAKIASYADLAPDFDGYGGHAPAPQDIENARSFIQHIPDAGMESVQALVVGDGEVGFEWKEPEKNYLEIVFSEGEISFFGDMLSSGERLNGDADYDENAIPEKLQRLLSDLFPNR